MLFLVLSAVVAVQQTTVPDTLNANAAPIDTIVITATRDSLSILTSPLPASILSGAPLRRTPDVSLAHALEGLAGVHTLSTGQQVGKPVIRGLTGARVLVLDDTHRLEEYSWSDEDGPSVDARTAQRIEVIRGPASVLYGSDAIGGVVNVVPRSVPSAPVGTHFTRGAVELYGASNNKELFAGLSGEGARGPLGWRLFGIGRRAADYDTPAGEVANTGFEAFNGEAEVGLQREHGNATLRYARYGGEFKLLEAGGPRATPAPEEEGGPERKTSDDRLQFTGNTLVRGLRLETKAQWQRHSLSELADAAEAGGTGTTEAIIFDLLLNTFSADVLLHHGSGSRLHGTVGVSGMFQNNDTRGPIALVPDARTVGGGIFAFEELVTGRFSWLAGARGDVHQIAADANAQLASNDDQRTRGAFSGDIGAVFHPAGALAIAANVGRAWRAPNLFELFANGPRLGEARYEIGRADLDPETSLNADLSVRWHQGRFSGEVAGYRNAIDGFIYSAPTTEFRDTLRVFRTTQARSMLWGAELSAELRPWSPLTLRGRYDYVRGTNEETDDALPLISPPRATLGAELESFHLHGMSHAYVGAETELVGKQTRLSAEERAALGSGDATYSLQPPGYGLLNLTAGIDRTLFGHDFAIDLRVRNATDRAYREYLSRYKEFALEPGRNVTVRVGMGL